MRLLLVFLSLAPLLLAECPPILQEVDEAALGALVNPNLKEALDTSCGRRNFTATFWHPLFYQRTMLVMSFKDQFKALKDKDAKRYVKDFYAMQRGSFRNRKLLNGENALTMGIFSAMFFNLGHILPLEAQLEMSQAFKSALQYNETSEMKRGRIYTAFRAFERVGTQSCNEKLGELFAKVYEMITENFIIAAPPFHLFAEWAKNEWNSTEIGHLEVVPALEVLYSQYAKLKNADAKALADYAIWHLATSSFMYTAASNSTTAGNLMNGLSSSNDIYTHFLRQTRVLEGSPVLVKTCPGGNVVECFKALSEDARTELTTTFPELFEYLRNDLIVEVWLYGRKLGLCMKALDYSCVKEEIEKINRYK